MARTDQRTNLIKGTATNDSATAGYVGQYIESVAGPSNFPTAGQVGDLTSISLTAGDWDVTALLDTTRNGATVTACLVAITTTSGNSFSGMTAGSNRITFQPPTAATDSGASVPNYRISLASTTTVYLKYYAEYTVATPQARGRISARRVR